MSHGIKDTVRCLINYLMLSMVSVAVLNVRSLSAGKLSDMLLKAAFGAHLFEEGSDESLNCEKSMDTAGTVGTNRTNFLLILFVFVHQYLRLCSCCCSFRKDGYIFYSHILNYPLKSCKGNALCNSVYNTVTIVK